MTDNESICEAYFRARGWTQSREVNSNIYNWFTPIDLNVMVGKHFFGPSLPNILESFPDFKREVLEVMEGEGYKFEVAGDNFYWWNRDEKRMTGTVIKDNEILKAAVIAATRYWEGKNV